ncbi:amidohydrolase family protein [Alphaproteobacteria bacterium]|nr:amidohydrolase family protein [Alphaproteobacteria bacterium]MBT5765621.1 amidohydrolase family protein [Kordiimonadaceae bacterium]MDA9815653.1 amidohydrolase family protein [Alphaproteobacteria bacterium]MDC3311720.1 amidohydrolase family protein [Alphaproteobacteria bacterium]
MTIRDCIAPDRNPKKPSITLPKGSIDTHVHIFENHFPLFEGRGYNPPDSTLEDLIHLHDTLGIDRVVFTQPSVYGVDNAAILKGMNELNKKVPNKARGVCAIKMDATENFLQELHDQGIRGVRLNLDNKGGMPLELSEISRLEDKIKGFGWHLEYLFPGKDMVELEPVLANASVPVSIGHFAYQPAIAGIEADGFKTLLRLVKDGNTWVKISGANRVSETDLPPYDDVLPMARALVEANPDNVMWGTDWPHPNKYEVNPNDGDLVNWFGEWITDEAMRHRIMVTNSELFFDFGSYQG